MKDDRSNEAAQELNLESRFGIPPRLVKRIYVDDIEFRDFCVTAEISNYQEIEIRRPFWGFNVAKGTVEPSQKLLELAQWLLSVPGIETCFFTPYRAGVCKSPAFEWEELMERISEAVIEVAYPGVNLVDIEIREELFHSNAHIVCLQSSTDPTTNGDASQPAP